MLKNEIEVLVIAHNICVAFEYVPSKEQIYYLQQLRGIEKDACSMAVRERIKYDREDNQ